MMRTRFLLPLLVAVTCSACATVDPEPGAPSPVAILPDVAPSAPESRFSVCLYTSPDAAIADDVASRARDRFDSPVLVLDRAGEYQVEIGNFGTGQEAEAFLAVARERGFPEATLHEFPAPLTTP